MKLQAILVDEIENDAGQQPGAIEFRLKYLAEDAAGIAFRCPCGCGHEGYLPIRSAGSVRTTSPEWEWDGDQLKPTLSPSILQSGLPCKWHGWLQAGEWRT